MQVGDAFDDRSGNSSLVCRVDNGADENCLRVSRRGPAGGRSILSQILSSSIPPFACVFGGKTESQQ